MAPSGQKRTLTNSRFATQIDASLLPLIPALLWINILITTFFDDSTMRVRGHSNVIRLIANPQNFFFGERCAFVLFSAKQLGYQAWNNAQNLVVITH